MILYTFFPLGKGTLLVSFYCDVHIDRFTIWSGHKYICFGTRDKLGERAKA